MPNPIRPIVNLSSGDRVLAGLAGVPLADRQATVNKLRSLKPSVTELSLAYVKTAADVQ